MPAATAIVSMPCSKARTAAGTCVNRFASKARSDMSICSRLVRLHQGKSAGSARRSRSAHVRELKIRSRLGSIEGDLGAAGAASGLAAVAKAAICLSEQIIPGLRDCPDWLGNSGAIKSSVFLPEGSQFWMRNRSAGARRAAVVASSVSGNCQRVVLEEVEADPAADSPAVQQFDSAGRQPGLFAIQAEDRSGLFVQIKRLAALASGEWPRGIDQLARAWWRANRDDSTLAHGLAIIADGVESLRSLLDEALERARGGGQSHVRRQASGESNRIYLRRAIPSGAKRLAFVYPGLGNQFPGMGRSLSLVWPELLRTLDAENDFLRDQLDPRVWWADDAPRAFENHLLPILGSVSLGCFVTDVLRALGLTPHAAIGYSLGETTALLALRAGNGRDEMLHRLRSSPLFQTELAGPCNAARRVWELPADELVDWVAGIVPCSVERMRAATSGKRRVEILIKNTADETVIGGSRRDVEDVVATLNCSFFELSTVSTVHCSIGRSVEREYLALHDVETRAPEGIAFYSGVSARGYALDRRSAAEAIAAQASGMIDFPGLIERAYEDGVRVFVEAGPGNSCTRLIGQILAGKPHLACSACRVEGDPILAIMDVAARLIAEGVRVSLAGLYGKERLTEQPSLPERSSRSRVRVKVRGAGFDVPAMPARIESTVTTDVSVDRSEPCIVAPERLERSGVVRAMFDAERATAEAHRAFLSVSAESTALIAKHVEFELELLERCARVERPPVLRADHFTPPPVIDRRACLEFAVGRIAAALGQEYAPD